MELRLTLTFVFFCAGTLSVPACQAQWKNGVRPTSFLAGSTNIALSIIPYDIYGNVVSSQATLIANYYLQTSSPLNASAVTSVQMTNLAISFNITKAGLYWLSLGDGTRNISGFPTAIEVVAGEC